MMVLRYKGEEYQAESPKIVMVGTRKYTCEAKNARTQRLVRNPVILNALGQMLMRGGKW